MMRRILFGSALLGGVSLFGCAHGHLAGTVVMKEGDSLAHACLDAKNTKVGDKLSLYSSSCEQSDGDKRVRILCTKKKLGDAQVENILDEHFVTIRTSGGFSPREGMIVEKN